MIDIRGGAPSDGEASALPFMPAYQEKMDRAPVLGSSLNAHDGALRAMEYLQTGAVRPAAEVMAAFGALASV